MKVLEPPNRFFPNRAFSVEDTNRDLSHSANMIRNDQDARFVYTNIRIPIAIVTNRQNVNANASDGSPNERPIYKGNHEAIRTFSFVPPFEMKIVKTEFAVMGGSDIAGEITPDTPMVAKVEWISEPGGEGFPPRPQSILPEGMKEAGDPDITKIHPQLTVNMEEDSILTLRVDNGEYRLKQGECYRVRVSDPDIPSISGAITLGTPPTVFDYNSLVNERNWRYKLGYIDLTLKYDKWIFQDPDRPDVNFFNAGDPINLASLKAETDGLEASRAGTTAKIKYPKPELYWFGLGQMSNLWAQPTSSVAAPTNDSQQEVSGTMQPQLARSTFSDFDSEWRAGLNPVVWYTKKTGNFHNQGVWRAPLAPSNNPDSFYPGFLFGKQVVGYSIGLAHCTANDFTGLSPLGSVNRNHGYEFYGTLGHGIEFNNADSASPLNYDTHHGNGAGDPQLRPSPPIAMPVGPTLFHNDTFLGSTAIPNTKSLIPGSDQHAGVATGFPGDYLAEIHGIGHFGNDPDAQTETGSINVSTSDSNFSSPPDTVYDGSTANILDDLFLFLNTSQAGFAAGTDSDLRNFQKFYVLLWVI